MDYNGCIHLLHHSASRYDTVLITSEDHCMWGLIFSFWKQVMMHTSTWAPKGQNWVNHARRALVAPDPITLIQSPALSVQASDVPSPSCLPGSLQTEQSKHLAVHTVPASAKLWATFSFSIFHGLVPATPVIRRQTLQHRLGAKRYFNTNRRNDSQSRSDNKKQIFWQWLSDPVASWVERECFTWRTFSILRTYKV